MITKNDNYRVWRLAGPLIISNISVALLGIVDTAVVGHLEHAYYIGAVAVATVVFDFIYWGMGFLRMGTTGVVAQIYGRCDNDEIRVALLHACSIALLISFALLIMQKPIIMTGLSLIGGSAEVSANAELYFRWAIWGAPAVLVTMSLSGWLLGMQNARATLVIAVTLNSINIILDLVLVFGLGMGVKGVALASVISQYCGLLMAIWFVSRLLGLKPGNWKINQAMDSKKFLEFLGMNQNIFIRTICLIFAFAFFTRQGSMQGDQILAANALLLNFQALMALGLDGFANAAEVLVGNAVGAKDRKSFVISVRTVTCWSVIIAICYSLFYAIAGRALINLITDLDTVRAAGITYLPWMVLSPLVSVWCFLLDGIFIGATRSREMRDMMLISTFMVFIPGWYVFQAMGNHGLWLAFMLFFAARGISLGLVYLKIERTGGFV